MPKTKEKTKSLGESSGLLPIEGYGDFGFDISQSDLAAVLTLVGRSVPSSPPMPVLANILLEVRSQEVCLTGFDLGQGVSVAIACETSETQGRSTVPGKLLTDIVSRLPDGPLRVAITDNQVVVISGGSRYAINGITAKEYPAFPDLSQNGKDAGVVTMHPGMLQDGIKSSLFCASSDETQKILTGVHVVGQQQTIEMVATNGHRLGRVTTDLEGKEKAAFNMKLTIPSKSLQELQRLLTAFQPKVVNLTWNHSIINFEWDRVVKTTTEAGAESFVKTHSIQLIARLIDGDYPEYPRLFPASYAKTLVFDRSAMVDALERVAVFAEHAKMVVTLKMSKSRRSEVVVEADVADYGRASERVPCQYQGNSDFEIAFNIRYLLECLKYFQAGDVMHKMNAPTSATVLHLVGQENQCRYLLMPIEQRRV